MRTRTYQNKADKKAGTFHVQIVLDPDEADLFVAGDKAFTKAVKDRVEEAVETATESEDEE